MQSLAAWAAFALSLAALGGALFALRKVGTLEFRPEVLAGDVILPRPSRPGEAPRLILPLHFTNSGFADGIIQWMALRLTCEGDAANAVLLSPLAEVDMTRFIEAGRKLTPQNTVDPFTGFPLEGKRAAARFVLFDVAERARIGPLRLRPGRWGFELFVKASHARNPRLEASFEHLIEQKHLEELGRDSAVYLVNYHITLPAVRRAMVACEWVPRAGVEMRPGRRTA